MAKQKQYLTVKSATFAYVGLLVTWICILALFTADIIPMKDCWAWEGEPWMSHCDAPIYSGFAWLMIWVGVFAFLASGIALIFLLYAHTEEKQQKSHKRRK